MHERHPVRPRPQGSSALSSVLVSAVSCADIDSLLPFQLAHYLKIGQRYTFIVQVYGSIVACLVATSILNYQMGLEKICQIDQPQHFYCNGEATFFTATVFWGTLGPTRVFGKGGVYTMLLFGFLIGAVLPFPFYFIAKRWPKSILGQVHVVVALYGVLAWGPSSTLACFWPGCVLAWVFMVCRLVCFVTAVAVSDQSALCSCSRSTSSASTSPGGPSTTTS